MTKKEYLKYNNPEAYDAQGKRVKPGDTVVINNYHSSTPYIGVVSHFTQSGLLCIKYDWKSWKGNIVKLNAYRESRRVIKLKDGNKNIRKY